MPALSGSILQSGHVEREGVCLFSRHSAIDDYPFDCLTNGESVFAVNDETKHVDC